MHVLLISTYELGRQPFGLASPAAWLRAAGFEVTCVDVAKTPLSDDAVRAAEMVAFHLPMHTATRLALPLIDRVRQRNRSVFLCGYGLYAPLNGDVLRSHTVDAVLGGEFEADLVSLARDVARQHRSPSAARAAAAASSLPAGGVSGKWEHASRSVFEKGEHAPRAIRHEPRLPRLDFLVPDRAGLPPLARYATLQIPGGEAKLVGYTEASRGCKHRCRHCPVVPVYQGQFRIVRPDVVVADIREQVDRGATHITFGDPDFFNSVRHALRVVELAAHACPGLTYDVTIKVEHLLRHARDLPALRDTGCLFVTSAVESIDDAVLARLEKGHTRDDFLAVVTLCRELGLTLVPTFVPFTPWTTAEGYCDLLDTIARLGLIEHVPSIQLAIRLLLPHGSRLLELEEIRAVTGAFDPEKLVYPWRHPDPAVDELQRELMALVGRRLNAPRGEVFAAIVRRAFQQTGRCEPQGAPCEHPLRSRAAIPYLNEPWYC